MDELHALQELSKPSEIITCEGMPAAALLQTVSKVYGWFASTVQEGLQIRLCPSCRQLLSTSA